MIGRRNNNDELHRKLVELEIVVQSQANAIKSLHNFHNQYERLIGNITNEIQALRLEVNELKKNISIKDDTIELLGLDLLDTRKGKQRAEKKIVKLKRKLRNAYVLLQKNSSN